ncbi:MULTISPECIES: ABC transporter ATP-binding protein [Mameliella]|uniref:ABC transporter ATP-binding protein n=1 Tax=Mameliella alba TaxID=561184 RepID=A0A0B3RJT4_9RHOB|nr:MULTISPECIES: ABC transporter ATP-binding protein [Mameliella]MBV6634556.1 ABC transporter ATP-binding protein [Mameliella sp.]MCR9274273.1 ABC transporter ATP-binding protein [Paracoccaceae bacterium]ODM50421.1 ABC transporter [Ruegeria sp. PBVC088]KHQ51500.1 ABC transporter ATP-binding protein [Mameliella alba]MBY6118121.1 ABC transporter ATP-binding protein [Mameliella alba]
MAVNTNVTPAIQFTDVEMTFDTRAGELIALQHVNLAINDHEFIAVLGPSGCGKSTLMRIVAGLLKPSAGTVSVHGENVVEPRDDIGIVFQKPTLLPWATLEDNVVFPMKHKFGRVTQEQRERAHELLKLVGLASLENRRPGRLSGGMQQRVGIARALLHNPDILLMDEPFSALDALTREEMGYELQNIWQEHRKTVMFITHSIVEAVLLADRIIVMSHGPGAHVAEDLRVPAPRPRTGDSMRLSEMQDLVSHLRDILMTKKVA